MKKSWRHAAWLGFVPAVFALGCACEGGVDRCAEIVPGAIPEPPHTVVHRILETQAAKAEADDFVVYKHEFFMDGAELGPYGQYHLRLIANRLNNVPFPVLLQAAPDAKLNEQRRQSIVAFLQMAGLENVEPRVIVGFPEAEGIGGEEAERINNSLPQAGTGVNGSNLNYRGGYFNGGFFGSPRSGFFRSAAGPSTFPF